ncbi:MAG: hypothetical protein HN368_07165 [Spirochaetales bacterium]|jgi:uroporphyrinogen decarboxylase|nr:hypothetical protein [Spirochaetales bacterium]
MNQFRGLYGPIRLDYEALISNLLRKGTPDRVFHMELFQDVEIADAIAERFGLCNDLNRDDPDFAKKKYIAVQRFCGFDYIRSSLDGYEWPLHKQTTEDTAELKKEGGRNFQDEHTGPISNWEDFEKYPWPDPSGSESTQSLEWYQKNLPDDMCIVTAGMSHFCELITWLLGYETFCFALFDQRDLLSAIVEKLVDIHNVALEQYLSFDRVKIVFASDDMGFKTGLLFSAEDMIELVLKPHKVIADRTHQAGIPYLLHSCGKLDDVIEYLIDEIRIDGKHSFEDTIEDVRQVKTTYGKQTSLIGGIDVDFLCRAGKEQIRERVRKTLDVCLPGGGYCLGTGNSVANYIPLENYLTMVDEGRLYR